LVYVDESGDPGMELDRGASELLLVAAVVFRSEDDAASCDQCINDARKTLGLPPTVEFKFSKSSAKVRLGFLSAVAGQRFSYSAVVIHKRRLMESDFAEKEALYQKTVLLTFDRLRPHLKGAFVEIDRSGGEEFSRRLCKYLAKVMACSDTKGMIKEVKTVRSRTSNRVQLADMICGAVGRSFSATRTDDSYRRLVCKRELEVIEWP